MASKGTSSDLHIVMFPWLAFGHMMPYLELAKSLAIRGHRISYVSTPRNIKRLPKIPPDIASVFTFVQLQLPQLDDLPSEAEATTDLPVEKVGYLKKAFDGLESPLAEFLASCSPDWIIYDFAPYWVPSIAAKLGVRTAFLCIFNASFLSFFGPPSAHLGGKYEGSRTTAEDFTVPCEWIPFDNNLVFRLYEINKILNSGYDNVSGASDGFRHSSAVQGSDLVAVRTSTEIESEWLKLLEDEIFQKPVIPIGLLPPCVDSNEKWVEHLEIQDWLDKRETNSIIYVALGTEAALRSEETTELALGLELSKLPFFWVLRTPIGFIEPELPQGFEERVKGLGYICRSLAPQQKILSHRSVGGFLTHCGWSSVVESLCLGCPLVLLPIMNDQSIVARTLEWKKISFEVPRNEVDGSFTRKSVADSIRKLVVDEGGELYRNKVKELKEIVGDTTKQDYYFDHFGRYLMENKNKRQV